MTISIFPEGHDLAKNFGCKFFETSAKTLINVDKVFSELVREIRRYNEVCFIRFHMKIIFSDELS